MNVRVFVFFYDKDQLEMDMLYRVIVTLPSVLRHAATALTFFMPLKTYTLSIWARRRVRPQNDVRPFLPYIDLWQNRSRGDRTTRP